MKISTIINCFKKPGIKSSQDIIEEITPSNSNHVFEDEDIPSKEDRILKSFLQTYNKNSLNSLTIGELDQNPLWLIEFCLI